MILLSLMNLWYFKILYHIFSLFDHAVFGRIFIIQKLNDNMYRIIEHDFGYELPTYYNDVRHIGRYFDSRDMAVEYLYRKYGENIDIRF